MERIRDKVVITRKEHMCWGCLKKFPPKTEMHSQTNVEDVIYTLYHCMDCQEELTKIDFSEYIDDLQAGWKRDIDYDKTK